MPARSSRDTGPRTRSRIALLRGFIYVRIGDWVTTRAGKAVVGRDCKPPRPRSASQRATMRSLTAICSSLALLAIWAAAASAQSGSEFDQYVPGIPAADQEVPLPDALDDDKGEDKDGGGSEDDGSAAEGPSTGFPSP